MTAINLGVPLGTGALIAALQPLTTAAMAGRLLGETVRPMQWIGLGLGLLGVLAAVSGSLGTAPLWAWLMFSEPIKPLILAGFLLCMAGVWLAARTRHQRAP